MNIKELYQKLKKGKEDLIIIEGLHAFKHAARFGADFIDVVTDDKACVKVLMRKIATDSDVEYVEKYARDIGPADFAHLASQAERTGLVAFAKKPHYTVGNFLDGPIVFVENPHDINNVGAVIRVAAAFGAGAVCMTGEVNPWHVVAVRAAAGLQWAVPVVQVSSIDDVSAGRTVYACDADGHNMYKMDVERNGVFVFGTERNGISPELKERADHTIAIPMQENVSSMNLATSVSAVLFGCLGK
ncbi:MAG: rRNA methyltransferase [Candidatus Moraniibacteriota bacterium]|nr:MAG: rRNA methyltransferase [Candidatus Moranbacteria bacterium]